VLQYVAVAGSVLHLLCCSVLQGVAVRYLCSAAEKAFSGIWPNTTASAVLQCVVVCCSPCAAVSVLQCVAVSVLQCVT